VDGGDGARASSRPDLLSPPSVVKEKWSVSSKLSSCEHGAKAVGGK
jgi:hypothetical protein